jgi:deoxyribonuclease V
MLNMSGPIVALDVDYRQNHAIAAGVWFQNWTDETPLFEQTVLIDKVEEYQPGEFYRRELPCLLEVLKCGPMPSIIVIDGYVWLADRKPGLGAKLHEAIQCQSAVIGVAKTKFHSATDCVELLRGQSQSALFVSSVGVDVQQAALLIGEMHGEFRIPTLLKRVDHFARQSTLAATSQGCEDTP